MGRVLCSRKEYKAVPRKSDTIIERHYANPTDPDFERDQEIVAEILFTMACRSTTSFGFWPEPRRKGGEDVRMVVPIEQVRVGDRIDGKEVKEVLHRKSVGYVRIILEGGWPIVDGYRGKTVTVERG